MTTICRTRASNFDSNFSIEPDDVVRAQFFGLGSDGTVGANKESIKIIGENTDYFAQGYFVYDSKKSGAMTISHLRFGQRPIRSTYLISKANFVACHQPFLLETYDVLRDLAKGGTFLLNSPLGPDRVCGRLPENVQRRLIEQRAKFFVIDGNKVARDAGMGGRINTVMQTCFFAISGVLPAQQAIEAIKNSIRKTYGKKGDEIVEMNLRAVDQTLAHLYEVKIPDAVVPVPSNGNGELKRAPEFVRNVLGEIIAGRGDRVPVSALPNDGTYPTGTTQFEKRNLATEVPVWDPAVCIQCGRCVMVCPHAVIRSKAYDAAVPPRRAFVVQIGGGAITGVERTEIHAASGSRRLYRLRDLRRCLPGAQQIRSAIKSHQYAAAVAAARSRARELELLPFNSGDGSPPGVN